jgi:hypothetical protein
VSTVSELMDTAVKAVETYLTEGINLAMTKHNGTITV